MVWDKYFAPFKPANFGIGGDTTHGVLWRIQNRELEGIHPKLVVLNIGTNHNKENPKRLRKASGESSLKSSRVRLAHASCSWEFSRKASVPVPPVREVPR